MEPTRITLRARRAAILATVATAAVLAIPGGGRCRRDRHTSGNTATLTGDGAADNIIIGVTGANLSHNLGTATGFNSPIDFNSAVADDQVVTADTGTLTINGGDGDDNIVGSKNADHLIGGLGSDRITGFTGPDDVDGGEGNDVMTWNNGDGNDTNDGEGGIDETQINGRNTTDDTTVRTSPAGGSSSTASLPAVQRQHGHVERLNINTQAGDDKLVTSPA